ncbi:ABC-type transport auxiliary lipoprotein family protein [Brevundimonas goettingensis]|uniref:Membrane integrity-associated transporter subunit PqiC n=1 Tax=Brevundimonas goettingensis TaxID=2774190 RepID=A0A975GUC8_9CAUL|nr:ABC-type transport auxiliary lipoprotein family protein [Brevundimonas goettingensis]QTC89727.1 membrane integrity-associated transporter subunit PqiC [Brevundimonas goettingensis]
MIPTRILTVAAVAFALSGCSLLSTPKPVQLYRFGSSAPEAPGVTPQAMTPIPVALRRIDFPEASKGDRLLGVTGTEAAYIKGARWVSPAEVLFNDSLEAAFASNPRVRLIGRREPGIATRVLSVDVTRFEARYDAPGGTPTVVITARARMTILPERNVTSEEVFTVSQPANENRVSAIVSAFDIASRDLNAQIADWTATAAPTAAPAPATTR